MRNFFRNMAMQGFLGGNASPGGIGLLMFNLKDWVLYKAFAGGNANPSIESGATFKDGVTLTWEELKLEENGTKYHYDASAISDTEVGCAFECCLKLTSITIPEGVTFIDDWEFDCCSNLTSITIPASVTSIGYFAFCECSKLNMITYAGTVEQWNAIQLENNWNETVPATEVVCSNGKVAL